MALVLRRRTIKRLGLAAVVASLLAGVALMAALYFAPLPADPVERLTGDATKIYDRHGHLLYEVAGPAGSHTYVSLEDISPALWQATIATEDASFFDNPGVDIWAAGRALFQNLREGRLVSGGSTITQQLARNLYLSPDEGSSPSLWRKLRESILAIRLSRQLSKDDILELYLNQVYYGNLAYGVEAAARTYFGKPARDLDLAEAALLAGLPQAPAAHDPFLHPAAARERQRTVLSLMVEAGYITDAEADAARRETLRFNPTPFPIEAPHFVVYVQALLDEMLGSERVQEGGLRVYTTLDIDLQAAAEATARRHIDRLRDSDVSNAALVALDPNSGQILAMLGSVDYFDEEIDGAVNVAIAPRQPGSAIKPVLYAAALAMGYTPATPIYDVHTAFTTRQGELFVPNNYDGLYHGIVPLRIALASSYNVPAVRVLRDVGLERFLNLADALGISTFGNRDRFDLSVTLGGGEVTLLDLTTAYAAFASGGLRREPAAILRVEDTSGNVLYEWQPPPEQRALSPQVAYLITDILSDEWARAPGFGWATPLSLSRPAAAKTGTTSDWRDNWTVGYTPDLVTGVWVGNADNRPMRHVSGITGAAPIWHDFMEEALQVVAPHAFPRPEGLVEAEVCSPMGGQPGPWCQDRRLELFVAGSEPRQVDDYYRPLRVCASTGELATAACPPDQVVERVFEFPPAEVIPWARAAGVALPPLPPYKEGTSPAATTLAAYEEPSAFAVRLVSPDPELVLHISSALPRESQALPVEALVSGAATASEVRLYDNGRLLAILDQPPFRFAWPLEEGRHQFQASAFDDGGKRVDSDAVGVNVLPP
jgi:1A family penicillin-binding protein